MMPWFPGDFMRSTRGWSCTVKGVYRELLDAQWDMGILPIAIPELQQTAGATNAEWAAAWPKIETKFPVINGCRQNDRLEEHRRKALELSITRSEVGKKGGKARAKAEAIARANAKPAANYPSPSPSPSPEPNQTKKVSTPSESHPRSEREIDVMKVFKHWQVTFHKTRSALDDKRRRIITKALDLYGEATLCQAITGITHSPHHMGQNDRNTRYVDIEHCIGSPKRVDHGLECYSNPPSNLTLKQIQGREVGANWVPPELRNANK